MCHNRLGKTQPGRQRFAAGLSGAEPHSNERSPRAGRLRRDPIPPNPDAALARQVISCINLLLADLGERSEHPMGTLVDSEDRKPKQGLTNIYVMYNEERNRCKIGKANAPKKRLSNLQTGSVDDLEITCQLPVDKTVASSVERLAHKIAVQAGKRKKREWFSRTTPEEAQGFVEIAHHTVRGRNS